MIDALIFDFDGLIVETEGTWFDVWQETYLRYDQPLPFDLYARTIGTSFEAFDPWVHLESLIGRSLDREPIRRQQRVRYAELIQDAPILPGVIDHLDRAAELGIKLAVASSSDRNWVVGHLSRLHLVDRFAVIRTSNDVARVKPDPELYLSATTMLGATAWRTIAFEDSPNGLRSARDAGLFCIVVPNALTARLPLEDAHLRLRSLADHTLDELIIVAAGRS